MLRLHFLGSPCVYLNDTAVEIDRRKVLALLAYLAVTEQRHSRDELAELLYGEQDRAHARANLRQSLSFLRNAIGKERLGANRLSVWLQSGSDLWIDVSELQRLLKNGQNANANGNHSVASSHLTKAVELFRGEFLSGFYIKDSVAFEEWQLMMQENLCRQHASALKLLVEIHWTWGRYEQAIDFAQQLLALDPLDEAVQRQLMQLYSVTGRHAEALLQYENCRRALERELGEKPEPETEQLGEYIVSRKPLKGPREYPSTRMPKLTVPLFLFVRSGAADEDRAIHKEARLRRSIKDERGRILITTGRMSCAVFPTASAAVRAALSMQSPTETVSAKVRIALLSEESTHQPFPSSGLIKLAEMLLDASHPGQVLLNESASELIGEAELPEQTALRCLGARRLRDLGPPQSLHLLEYANLAPGSDQLETLDSRPNNLQIQPTPFIGREEELQEVQSTLKLTEVQLLTLIGAGGTGKTRLGLQAAAGLYKHFKEGLFFVDLAALRDPNHVIGAIAATLDVRESGSEGRSLLQLLKDFLGNKRILLLLDNFEHLLSAAPQVAELLASCAQLKILCTSREALHLRAERVYMVPTMRLPSQGQRVEAIKRCEAIRLFADRAVATQPAFELSEHNVMTIAEICSRLDGLPLAIELAAARIRMLTPQDLLMRLKNRLDMLKQGARDLPDRQQTLKSEIDWSYELLGSGERCLFRRLAVFPAGCTLDAAEAVCRMEGEDLDVLSCLSSLTEKSLVWMVESNGKSRFRMLETIREYAWRLLEDSGELDILQSQFAEYFLQFAEQAELRFYGSDQMKWFDRIEDDYGNIRVALLLLYDRKELTDGIRLAGALGWFWFRRGRFTEGQHWLQLYRDAANEEVPSSARAKAAYFLGWMKLCFSSVWGNPEGKLFFRESLSLWRRMQNLRGAALSQVLLAWKVGEIEDEEDHAIADESVAVARETEDPWTIAMCLKVAYSNLRRQDKDLDCRKTALEEAVALARKTGDPFLLSQTLTGTGDVFNWIGELETALVWYRDSLHIAREIGDIWSILYNNYCLAEGYLRLERIQEAKEYFAEGLQLALDFGVRGYLGWFIGGFYSLAKLEGRGKRAMRLGAFSESILNPTGRYDSRFAEELGLKDTVAAAEWRIGQSMTPEQAVTFALSEG